MLEIALISLILISVGLLIISLRSVWSICREQGTFGPDYAWKCLGFLIALFILGYLVYLSSLLESEMQAIDFVVAFILFAGSCFVVAVMRLSLISIKEVKKSDLQVQHHALHDALTNLPNRVLLNEAMSKAIAIAKRKNGSFAVMLMDLNNFKEVNDTLGHFFGDKLLQYVAPVLKKSVREIDTVARLGGDEFAVILPDANIDDAKTIASRIICAMERPFLVDQHEFNVGISIGISQYPEDGIDGDSLLQKADVAMYIAKHNASGFSVYNISRGENSLAKLVVLEKLRSAIAENKLTLHYQPIINLHTGGLYALEVLTRWHDDELGDIRPDEFIPVAEQSGSIKQLSLWVLETAIRQFMKWKKFNLNFILSINLSAKDIQDEGMLNTLRHLLSKYEMNPSQLNIEIIESSMMLDSKQPNHLISELNQLGVSLSIDDFGTGFSPLSYLKKLSTQAIKIDKSFVVDMLDDHSDDVIVRSIINIAHNLNQAVVAEGIETSECLERLKELNCRYGQGYFICRPLPVNQINTWLQENGIKDMTIDKEAIVAS